MTALDRAIAGLDKVQNQKMRAAKQTTREVNDFAVNVAKTERWTQPNRETSPGTSADRG